METKPRTPIRALTWHAREGGTEGRGRWRGRGGDFGEWEGQKGDLGGRRRTRDERKEESGESDGLGERWESSISSKRFDCYLC